MSVGVGERSASDVDQKIALRDIPRSKQGSLVINGGECP